MSKGQRLRKKRDSEEAPGGGIIRNFTLQMKHADMTPDERMATLMDIMLEGARLLKLHPSAILDVSVEITQRQISMLEHAVKQKEEKPLIQVPKKGLGIHL